MFDQLRLRLRAESARRTGRRFCIGLDITISLFCIGYIIFGVIFSYRPGPTIYYSHFVGILLATCLIFTCFQHFLLTLSVTKFYNKPCTHVFMWIYWVTINFSGLICGIGYCLAFKPDCLAMGFITCIIAKIAMSQLLRTKCRASSRHPNTAIDDANESMRNSLRESRWSISFGRTSAALKHPTLSNGHQCPGIVRVSQMDPRNGATIASSQLLDASTISTGDQFSPAIAPYERPKLTKALRAINRILKVIHWAIAILNSLGAIVLPLQNRYANPGTLVRIALPDGLHRKFNYNCTLSIVHNASKPTIWFEADAGHGIVDFLGLQTYLATYHNISSCSYDPPNFGWSDPLPAWYTDWNAYLPSLLTALGQENQSRIYAGWGGGLEISLKHAIADQSHALAVIDLDAAPDGIEFFDAQRANNWTDAQRLAYRHSQLGERASLTRTLLTLGTGWGLTPVFVPGNSSAYFDRALYPRYHAQGLKDSFWAMQYFLILQEAASPTEDPYLNSTILPEGIELRAILTENPVPGNEASNEFYREVQLAMAERIAGGRLDMQWCEGNCTLSFPVDRAEWTAGVIASLVEGLL